MQGELKVVREAAKKHAIVVDDTHYQAEGDTYGKLMAIVADLKAQGWKSGMICFDGEKGNYRINVFPPGQEPEARGVFFKAGEGARRYCLYIKRK